jgi:hypothetical protein
MEELNMARWLISRNGVFVVSLLAMLLFIGRDFYDFRFESPKQDPRGDTMLLNVAVFLVLLAAWEWALAAARDGRRAALVTLIILSLLLNVVLSLLTFFVLCPPGCEGWPTWQFWNWGQLIVGLLAAIVAGLNLRSRQRT